MIGQGLGQAVPQIPTQTEAVCRDPHELALGAQPLEKEDKLQLEEDDRVDGGPADLGVGALDEIADEGQVERPLQVPVEVVRGD